MLARDVSRSRRHRRALFTADTVTGRDGPVRYGLPVDEVRRLMERLTPSAG
jgi:hypothetical protein